MSLYPARMTPGGSADQASSSLYGPPPSSPALQYSSPHMKPLELADFSLETAASHKNWQPLYVLPVLLLEFLALALTRAVLPGMLLKHYDKNVYLVMGCAECVRGLLAFFSCPLFGKLSDTVGRRICLFVTVAGTCAPVCSLALMAWFSTTAASEVLDNSSNVTSMAEPDVEEESNVWPMLWSSSNNSMETLSSNAITVFVILLALSGVFSSTFTLVFAYISDTVRERDERVSAYGLALATFGLSFTIGPMAGGYIARAGHTSHVFAASLILTCLDLLYIYVILPESKPPEEQRQQQEGSASSWSPWETLAVVAVDPFLRRVGKVAFLYYTSLWAVISTLVLYAAKRFALGPERLGELMSALGLSTMLAEAVLVRIIVPILGEKTSMRLGLASFCLQCIILGLAYQPWHLFCCAAFSLLGNLVYPSLSSLVSGSVEPQAVGEALGALNGIKALTEGIGPLVFGSLMTLSEHSALPGWPYLLAALLAYAAYQSSLELPDVQKDEYIHELEQKRARQDAHCERNVSDRNENSIALFRQWILPSTSNQSNSTSMARPLHPYTGEEEDDDEEYEGLLSEIEESEDDVGVDRSTATDETRLPLTFASLMKQQQQQQQRPP